MELIVLKICTKCGESKPATVEFFYAAKKGRDGLSAACKECRSAYNRKHYAANRERYNLQHHEWHENNSEAVAVRKKAYRGTSPAYASYEESRRDLKRVYAAQWRQENREQILTQRAEYRASNRELLCERQSQWVANHPEYVREYNSAHRAEHAAHQRTRRARKNNNGGTHTATDVREQYERQKGKCFYCGIKVGDKYHVDHVIPLVAGGSNGPENLVIACVDCNQHKKSKHPMDFCGRML